MWCQCGRFRTQGGDPDLSLKIYEASYKGNSVFFVDPRYLHWYCLDWFVEWSDERSDPWFDTRRWSLQRQLGGKKEEHLWNKTESRKRVDLYGLQQRRENKSGDGTHRGKSGFFHSCDLCSFTTNTSNSMKGLRKQQLKITQPITPITLLAGRANDIMIEEWNFTFDIWIFLFFLEVRLRFVLFYSMVQFLFPNRARSDTIGVNAR